jgi:hypothetical protein
MAYAAYSTYPESLVHAFVASSALEQYAPQRRPVFVVMEIVVPSMEAQRARRALATCRDAGILRCVPMPHDRLVRLEVHLPAACVSDAMHCVMTNVQSGSIGRIRPWEEQLALHAHDH